MACALRDDRAVQRDFARRGRCCRAVRVWDASGAEFSGVRAAVLGCVARAVKRNRRADVDLFHAVVISSGNRTLAIQTRVVRRASFVARRSSRVVRRSLFVVRRSSFVVRRSSFVGRRPSFVGPRRRYRDRRGRGVG
jgi:hypothetical protein